MDDAEVLTRLQTLAAEAKEQLDTALEGQLRAARAEIEHLKLALAHRTVIGSAVGILMERQHLDAKTAFDALARVSQDTNRKVHEIAQELSETGRSEDL